MTRPLFAWRAAITRSGLPATARHVALTLALHMDDQGGSCWPSNSTLQAETGLSRNTILGAVRTLEQAGWVTVHRADRRANRYIATTPAGALTAPPISTAGALTAPPAGALTAPPISTAGALTAPPGATTAPPLARPPRPNSSLNSPKNYTPAPDPNRTMAAALRLVAPHDR